MIGVTAEGRIVHTCRKAKSNFSVRVSSKMNRDSCCQSERKATQQDANDAGDCRSLQLSEEKLFHCKFNLVLILVTLIFSNMPFQGAMIEWYIIQTN